jgi:carboxypeptidase D
LFVFVFIAYYNAGSAALVLVLVFLIIGTFVWCRLRRKRVQLPFGQVEESIPLNSSMRGDGEEDADVVQQKRKRKGKERSREGGASSEALAEPPIFDVGDSDDDEFKHHTSHK